MKIRNESTILTEEQIKKIEESKNAKYVCETSLKANDQWYENPVAVFYGEEVHPVSKSRYFGVFFQGDYSYICNAASVEDQVITGVITEDAEIIYSKYRHDYIESGDLFIDGGRDYTRTNATEDRLVELVIRNGKIQIQLEKVVE